MVRVVQNDGGLGGGVERRGRVFKRFRYHIISNTPAVRSKI